MGAGKSVVGARVAQRLGWRFIDVDAEVERRCGLSIPEIFSTLGEDAFRSAEGAALLEALDAREVVVATGGGAVLSADNRSAMREAGMVVHLHANIDAQLDRLQSDAVRPLLAGDDRTVRLRVLADVRGPLYADLSHVRIDTSTLSPDEVCEAVLTAFEAAHP